MHETLERLRESAILAVIRTEGQSEALKTVEALLEGGVTAVELTFTTPGVEGALAEAAERYGEHACIGAGTVRSREQAEVAAASGARFLVTPHLDETLLAAMLDTGLPALPGTFTVSEVSKAISAGAEAVKLFPASAVGPGYLRALRGPLPELLAVPTGGIDVGNVESWMDAGALALGAGGELCPRSMISSADWDGITERARRFVEAANGARAKDAHGGARR